MGPLKNWLNSIIAAFFIVFCVADICKGADPTVSIDLIKTEDEILPATREAEIKGGRGTSKLNIDGFDVETDQTVVMRGDYIFKLLHERGVLDLYSLTRLLAIIKKLNPSLKDLDLIYPGEIITLPLKIEPIGIRSSFSQKTTPKDIPFDLYTVKKGDTVSSIIREHNGELSFKQHREYLEIFSQLNPEIKDLDIIFQDQKVRLPIFSKTTMRRPIERPLAEKELSSKDSAPGMSIKEKVDALRHIFIAMGERWVDSGEHFIPFPSGGHINLDAASFPILNVRTGKKIIFDINNKLTDDICRLIEKSWDQYKVLKMRNWTFTLSFDELLKLCSYPAVRRGRQPFVVDAAAPEILIEGDWIVTMGTSDDTMLRPKLAVISESSDEWDLSHSLRRYLSEFGIVTIEIETLKKQDGLSNAASPRGGSDIYIKSGPFQLVETLLDINNIAFISGNAISVYKGSSSGINLMVSADFMISRGGKDYIIDFSGLSKEMVSFLIDHKFNVLSVSGYEDEPKEIARKVLSFLGIDHTNPPPPLRSGGDKGVKVTINMDGVRFVSANRAPFLVLPYVFSDSIMSFLHEEGLSLIIPEY